MILLPKDRAIHGLDTIQASIRQIWTGRQTNTDTYNTAVALAESLGTDQKSAMYLDFHTWCHAVMHWNLPSNPVDLEQREGRVQRYKGHAVRKNIAECYGLAALSNAEHHQDPWRSLFSEGFSQANNR